jgi:lysophospholipase L1-like esterase/pimeloyl-ACP methyl ester carboxylesterase
MKKNIFILTLLMGLFASLPSAFAESGPAPIKIACIGDSITFGHGIQDRETNSYPAQLERMLGPGYMVKNFGVNSATLLKKGNKPYWSLPRFAEAQAFQPDIVTIMLGTNDTKPRNWIHKNEFESNYIEMLKAFQALPGKPAVYICTPIPVFPERWGINDKTVRQEVIPLVNKIAAETGVTVINLYKPLEGKADLVPDKVHPNAAGATIIAETIAGVIGKASAARAESAHEWEGEKSSFHSFDQYDFPFNGTDCKVVVPKKPRNGNPWVWRARFWGHEPQLDIAMLERGYYVVYCDVAHLFGNAEAVQRWNAFYDYLRLEHLFDDRPVLEGMSRGGLIVYNWASANPEKVKAIYGDAPVMDFKSWPGGKGAGEGSAEKWKNCLDAYGLTEKQALIYNKNPVDNLAPLAKAGVPIIHVVGDADETVPVAENTAIAETRYKKMGGVFEVIHKPNVGHHPHSLKDPSPIVDFIVEQEK